ncbi:hypothetical protein BKI52_15390 [marine bacterium AO1-C]|nr:hypothetical protein BKI52_15390 [marine bacterium AO1-C]
MEKWLKIVVFSEVLVTVVVLLFGFNSKTPNPIPCVNLGTNGVQFLKSLVGKWQGTAISTPLGQMPYDLEFKSLAKNVVKGESNTNGQVIHTWIFRLSSDNTLSLDFHSTFGNSWAQGLCVTKVDPVKGLLFSDGKPVALKVWVKSTSDASHNIWQAEILLRDMPHVDITAQRLKLK